ncbi:MAG: metal-sensitive transcriptional regulator [Chloroflexi bacterium]|nr:metal-sensitive transcriptional regulator [Chloroflexota bacterium]
MEEDQEIMRRLRKVEGQVKGLQKMVEEARGCEDVLTQVLAARAALDQVALRIVKTHIGDCLGTQPPEKAKANIARALELITRRS